MILILFVLLVRTGASYFEAKDCIVTRPFNKKATRDFSDSMTLAFFPEEDKSMLGVHGWIRGKSKKMEPFNFVKNVQDFEENTITFDFSDYKCNLESHGPWEVVQLLMRNNTEAKTGDHPSILVLRSAHNECQFYSKLEPPLKLEVEAHDTSVVFNCPVGCQISPYGLDDYSTKKTRFYLRRQKKFTKAEVLPENNEKITLTADAFPILDHWYKVDVRAYVGGIQILIDDEPYRRISTSKRLPYFESMVVTLEREAEASWCPQTDPETAFSYITTDVIVLSLVIVAVSIIMKIYLRKLKQKIEKVKESMATREAKSFKQLPHFMTRSSTPPSLPPPLNVRELHSHCTVVEDNYSDPQDVMAQDYTYVRKYSEVESPKEQTDPNLPYDNLVHTNMPRAGMSHKADTSHYNRLPLVRPTAKETGNKDEDQPYDKLTHLQV